MWERAGATQKPRLRASNTVAAAGDHRTALRLQETKHSGLRARIRVLWVGWRVNSGMSLQPYIPAGRQHILGSPGRRTCRRAPRLCSRRATEPANLVVPGGLGDGGRQPPRHDGVWAG
jgi:hypothetical protein